MHENRDALIERNNKNLSAQINELSGALPPETQSFYQDLLNKSEPAESSAFQEEINSVINYEIVFLALQKKE